MADRSPRTTPGPGEASSSRALGYHRHPRPGKCCANWKNELGAIRTSMAEKRVLLADALRDATGTHDYDYLRRQRGMFSLLELPPEGVEAARTGHGIYMVHDGRINIAGLPISRIPDLVSAVVALQQTARSLAL